MSNCLNCCGDASFYAAQAPTQGGHFEAAPASATRKNIDGAPVPTLL
jgi:hypothetical protein